MTDNRVTNKARHSEVAGERFGRLVAIHATTDRCSSGSIKWLCQCDCGNTVSVSTASLNYGNTRSCGCLRADVRAANPPALVHGHARKGQHSAEYKTWRYIQQRCASKSHDSYPWYGGKGIKVCDRWLDSFENFLEDMGERPDAEHSIDRIDSDGDYEPDNCRWLLHSENARRSHDSRA